MSGNKVYPEQDIRVYPISESGSDANSTTSSSESEYHSDTSSENSETNAKKRDRVLLSALAAGNNFY